MGCTGSTDAKAEREKERAARAERLAEKQAAVAARQRGEVTRRHGYVAPFHEPDPDVVEEGPRVPGAYKALLIGMDYAGTKFELASSGMNVHNQIRFLRRHGFHPKAGFRALVDGGDDDEVHLFPTHRAILEGMNWLVSGARPGDAMYLHISGHAVRVHEEGWCLVPADFAKAGVLPGELLPELARRVPHGARLTIVVDTVYAADLTMLPWSAVLSAHSYRWFQRPVAPFPGHTVVLSLASDDPNEMLAAAGALTSAFEEAVDVEPTPTYDRLMRRIRERVKAKLLLGGGGHKLPKLSSTHKFDVGDLFFLGCSDKDRDLLTSHERQASTARDRTRGDAPPPSAVDYYVGALVEAWFYTGWFPARVRAAHADGTYDLEWEDATVSMALPRSALRRPRGGPEAPLGRRPDDAFDAAVAQYPDPDTGRAPKPDDPPSPQRGGGGGGGLPHDYPSAATLPPPPRHHQGRFRHAPAGRRGGGAPYAKAPPQQR